MSDKKQDFFANCAWSLMLHKAALSFFALFLAVLPLVAQSAPPVPPPSLDAEWFGGLPALPAVEVRKSALPAENLATATVGVGDTLQVTVFGQPDMSAEVTVTENEEVSLPLIGKLRVGKLTQGEIEKLVGRRLREGQFLLNPEVSVQIRQIRSQMVSVLGEVVRPGRYPIQGRLTVLDLLATAGGLTARAEHVVYLLRRSEGSDENAQRTRIPIHLDRVSDPQRGQLDAGLKNDDMIYVGQQKMFYIYGEVRRPGSYPLEPELNVMRALSISGGVTERGSTRRIKIHRKGENQEVRELDAALVDDIQGGDVVFVKERLF
jgi:polysaccharide export outer membrane protein